MRHGWDRPVAEPTEAEIATRPQYFPELEFFGLDMEYLGLFFT